MQAQKQNDLDEIDLIICDEAHRSVGNLYSGKEKDKLNTFTLCHSNENINAKKEFIWVLLQRFILVLKKQSFRKW